MKSQRTLPLVLLSSALLLGACGTTGGNPPDEKPGETPGETPIESVLGTGPSTLSVDLVRSNRGVAVEGSTAYLYRSGDHKVVVGKATTNAQGYAEFAKIPEGRYDLVFVKTGWAGSAFNGAVAQGTVNNRLKVAQFESADPKATADVPQLKLETPKSFKASGEVESWQDLTAGAAFDSVINVRAYTVKNSDTPRVMRFYLFSLVTLDETGTWADVRTGLTELDPGYVKPGVGEGGQNSDLVTLNAAGLSGDVYLQVVGLDFNYNRVAYLVPIRINRAATGTTVAPGNVRAVSYTLSEGIDFLYNAPRPDAPTSGNNLWVTASWDAPVDLSGYTGFRVLRADEEAGPYKQVAFAGSAQCAAPADKTATTRRCSVNDNTATLETSKNYFYKVSAVGGNDVTSTAAQTYTLPEFRPNLLTPFKDAHDISLTPTYTIRLNLFPTGATGAQMELQVADFITGESLAYNGRRLVVRNGFDASGKPERQVLSNLQAGNFYYVFRDSWDTDNDPQTENDSVTYNAASDVLSVPHQFESELLGTAITPLQANRRYSWYINKAFAYRVADPKKPASATNPTVAYSVYSDPDSSNYIVPGGIRQQYTEISDFTTRK